jgi:glycine cleavage system H protein
MTIAQKPPQDLRYTKEHEWCRLKDKTIAVVGITQYAQDQLGDIVYVELPEVGEALKQGEPFGVVESTKAVSELFAPVSGKVVEVNEPLTDAPETINEDPYEEGWMVQIEMADPKELDALLDATKYAALVAEEHE